MAATLPGVTYIPGADGSPSGFSRARTRRVAKPVAPRRQSDLSRQPAAGCRRDYHPFCVAVRCVARRRRRGHAPGSYGGRQQLLRASRQQPELRASDAVHDARRSGAGPQEHLRRFLRTRQRPDHLQQKLLQRLAPGEPDAAPVAGPPQYEPRWPGNGWCFGGLGRASGSTPPAARRFGDGGQNPRELRPHLGAVSSVASTCHAFGDERTTVRAHTARQYQRGRSRSRRPPRRSHRIRAPRRATWARQFSGQRTIWDVAC